MPCQALVFSLCYFGEKIKYTSQAHYTSGKKTKPETKYYFRNMYLRLMTLHGQEWQYFFSCDFLATVRPLRDSVRLSSRATASSCSLQQLEAM